MLSFIPRFLLDVIICHFLLQRSLFLHLLSSSKNKTSFTPPFILQKCRIFLLDFFLTSFPVHILLLKSQITSFFPRLLLDAIPSPFTSNIIIIAPSNIPPDISNLITRLLLMSFPVQFFLLTSHHLPFLFLTEMSSFFPRFLFDIISCPFPPSNITSSKPPFTLRNVVFYSSSSSCYSLSIFYQHHLIYPSVSPTNEVFLSSSSS
ncbi:unnamed protein product [Acanthosepion pharaonis]|uniref:Uncharacterized protein n=1 Tax=Acanthosepion pharaonis TaxID=158019 RepID=A0A812CJ46_ACAPH|nr:unnamed protein product [Sepia pharaonis]